MKKYTVEMTHVADDFFWNVKETSTNSVIRTFYFEEDAKKLSGHLSFGGGFGGFTPNFFLLPTQKKKGETINEKFTKFLRNL